MEFRNVGMQRIARNLRVMPVDGEKDWSVAKHAEVEGIVRVLPDVFAADHCPLAESLLKTGMELVAITGVERTRHARGAIEERRQHVVRAPGAGEDEVLIERRFEGTRIGNPKHSFGWLHIIGNADSRLGLVCTRKAVVNILAQSEIEVPVTSLDLVFGVECKFLHIR